MAKSLWIIYGLGAIAYLFIILGVLSVIVLTLFFFDNKCFGSRFQQWLEHKLWGDKIS